MDDLFIYLGGGSVPWGEIKYLGEGGSNKIK